jgi:hypothetical protein
VNSRLAIAALLVIVVAILAFGEKKARAQNCELGAFGCGHPEQHHQYKQ